MQDKKQKVDLSEYKYGELIFMLLTIKGSSTKRLNTHLLEYFNNNLPDKYAYHQDIVLPLRRILISIINKLIEPEVIPERNSINKGNERFLYLKNIQVFDAHAQSNPYCVGVPSLTAVWGMLHNYQRRLCEQLGITLRFSSFSWFLRGYSAVQGKQLPEFSMYGANQKVFKRSGILASRNCDLTFDLVVRVNGDEDDLQKLGENNSILQACFPARFASGTMIPEWGEINSSWCCLYSDESQLFSVLKRLPNFGQWIMPYEEKMEKVDELITLLKENMTLCPIMSGFNFLETPKERQNYLEVLHCFVEPVIGVAQYMNAYTVRFYGDQNFFKRAFWAFDAQESFILIKKAKVSYGTM